MKALEHLSYREYLATAHWQEIRAAALWLAGYRCAVCSAERDLEVHHRHYETLGEERPGDLLVLCAQCHRLYESARLGR